MERRVKVAAIVFYRIPSEFAEIIFGFYKTAQTALKCEKEETLFSAAQKGGRSSKRNKHCGKRRCPAIKIVNNDETCGD